MDLSHRLLLRIMSYSRRDMLKYLIGTGIVVGGLGVAGGYLLAPEKVKEVTVKPKPKPLPTSNLKVGNQAHFRGPAVPLSKPDNMGLTLAAEEINASDGILGRKVDVVARDEAGTDETVKEYKRLVLEDKIDFFIGLISSGNTPAVAPVAEELGCLTIFVDGCTDYLFDKADINPHFVFRTTNINSADGIGLAVKTSLTWPNIKKIAHIHPDYAYGHNCHDHFMVAIEKLIPGVEEVYVGYPKLFETDFTPHITKAIESKPDILVCSLWGGDYITFYKQALEYGLYDKMKFASHISHGIAPQYIGLDHPEGTIAGVHSNWYFTWPRWDVWPISKNFNLAYHKKYNEYPNFEAEGAYKSLYAVKMAIELAYKYVGEWPSTEDIITVLEHMGFYGPTGYTIYRPDNHQGYTNAHVALSKNDPKLGFNTWDLNTVTDIAIEKITAPPGWPVGEPTRAYTWVKKTWPERG